MMGMILHMSKRSLAGGGELVGLVPPGWRRAQTVFCKVAQLHVVLALVLVVLGDAVDAHTDNSQHY